MAADVVLFDPAAIADHATFERPQQYATGVRGLFVNGMQAGRGRAALRRPRPPSAPSAFSNPQAGARRTGTWTLHKSTPSAGRR